VNKKEKSMLKERIEKESDFIYCPRLGNSLKKFVNTHSNGVDDERICKVLLINQKELDEIFESAIKKIRKKLNIVIDE